MNYPVELKMKILSEYEQGKVGYKLLARKYGLKRDIIRYWVLTNKVHMKIEDKIQTEEKDIADFEIINSMPEFVRDSYGYKKKSRYLLENHQRRMAFSQYGS